MGCVHELDEGCWICEPGPVWKVKDVDRVTGRDRTRREELADWMVWKDQAPSWLSLHGEPVRALGHVPFVAPAPMDTEWTEEQVTRRGLSGKYLILCSDQVPPSVDRFGKDRFLGLYRSEWAAAGVMSVQEGPEEPLSQVIEVTWLPEADIPVPTAEQRRVDREYMLSQGAYRELRGEIERRREARKPKRKARNQQ